MVEKKITLKSRKLSVENVTPEPKDIVLRFMLLLLLLLLLLLSSLKHYQEETLAIAATTSDSEAKDYGLKS